MSAFTNQSKRRLISALCLLLLAGPIALAQSSRPENAAGSASIEAKIDSLTASLDETRSELAESRQEIRELRALLEQLSVKLASTANGSAPMAGQTQRTNIDGVPTAAQESTQSAAPAKITQDDWDVLNSRLEEQRQVKVESASKFPLRLSGMLLLNTIVNSSRVNNFDAATVAAAATTGFGSTGFSLRQSIIGIEGTGPRIAGAETSAAVQADFFGGLSSGYGASVSGLMRLRLARMRIDWPDTSIIGGLDTPFFSPDSPTSYLTVAEPGFSSAGNLWTWTPQIRVEQRLDVSSSAQFRAEAGIVDVPSYVPSISGNRLPSPGETSRQPGYALRFSMNGRDDSRPWSLGISGVYLTQRFPGPTTVSGGGGMADWNFRALPHVEFSGEMFAGKGLDAFGATPVPVVTQQNYIEYITGSGLSLARIPSFGGWSQIKFRVNSRGEINFAVGGAGRDGAQFRRAAQADAIIQNVAFKNASFVVNYIYRPRSDLVFSAEYRRLRTYQISGLHFDAGQTGLTAGFLF